MAASLISLIKKRFAAETSRSSKDYQDTNFIIRHLEAIWIHKGAVIEPENYDLWLDAGVRSTERLMPLLRPYPREKMTTYAVSLMVNSPSNDSPRCVEPAREN